MRAFVADPTVDSALREIMPISCGLRPLLKQYSHALSHYQPYHALCLGIAGVRPSWQLQTAHALSISVRAAGNCLDLLPAFYWPQCT